MDSKKQHRSDEIRTRLRSASELRYGSKRTAEIDEQLQHLAEMLTRIQAEELQLQDEVPLGPTPIVEV